MIPRSVLLSPFHDLQRKLDTHFTVTNYFDLINHLGHNSIKNAKVVCMFNNEWSIVLLSYFA